MDDNFKFKEIILKRVMMVIALFASGLIAINTVYTLTGTYNDAIITTNNITRSNIQYFKSIEKLISTMENELYPEITRVMGIFEKSYFEKNGKLSVGDLEKIASQSSYKLELYVVGQNGVIRQSTYLKDIGLDLFGIEALKKDFAISKITNKMFSSKFILSELEGNITKYYYYPLQNGEFIEVSVAATQLTETYKSLEDKSYNSYVSKAYPYIESIRMLDINGRPLETIVESLPGGTGKANPELVKALEGLKSMGQRHVVDQGLKKMIYEPIELNQYATGNRYIEIVLNFEKLFSTMIIYVICQGIALVGVLLVSYKTINRFMNRILIELDDARKRLVLSEKMATFGLLIAGVGHQINTPLGIMTTAFSYLEEKYEAHKSKLSSYDKNFADESMRDIESAIGMIGSNLEAAKKIVTKFQSIIESKGKYFMTIMDTAKIVEDVISSRNEEFAKNNISVSVKCDDSVTIISDPNAFRIMLDNLIDNSIVHGFDNTGNGDISISLELVDSSVVMTYEDNGRGIPESDREKVFIPFYTTRKIKSNAGLGLSFVYNYVTETSSGEIRIEDTKDKKGVRFVITLPSSMK